MIDKSREPAAPGQPAARRYTALAAFTPVPRRCARHDGWTAERQRGFIAALADSGSVRAAANAVNMTPEGAYLLRRHPEAGTFRKAWEAALKLGVQRLEDIAMDRALHGVEVPVYSYGKMIGTRRVYNDALLMFLLRNRAPRRFAADSLHSGDAVTKAQLAKLKQQWRAEWEAERHVESEEILDSIDRKLDLMRDRRRAAMSPRLRALEDAFDQACKEEKESGYRAEMADDDEDKYEEAQ